MAKHLRWCDRLRADATVKCMKVADIEALKASAVTTKSRSLSVVCTYYCIIPYLKKRLLLNITAVNGYLSELLLSSCYYFAVCMDVDGWRVGGGGYYYFTIKQFMLIFLHKN